MSYFSLVKLISYKHLYICWAKTKIQKIKDQLEYTCKENLITQLSEKESQKKWSFKAEIIL